MTNIFKKVWLMVCSRLTRAMFFPVAIGLVFLVYMEWRHEGFSYQCIQNRFKEKPRLLEPLGSKLLGPAGSATAEEELERLWNYFYTRQYDCTKNEYIGGKREGLIGDGAYSLCTEEQFWPADYDPNYKCLVYSFGVGGDFSFDDEMAKKGCEVHSFDPSENLKDGLIRDSGVVFHKVGISNKNDDADVRGWKKRTLKTLIRELGHADRQIDVLKVDTDGTPSEITMQYLLDTGLHKCIRQYSMEIHMVNPLSSLKDLTRCRYLYKVMVDLNTVGGWRLYNTTENVRAQRRSSPNYSNRIPKAEMLTGKRVGMLFEPSFVNFDVAGTCRNYL